MRRFKRLGDFVKTLLKSPIVIVLRIVSNNY